MTISLRFGSGAGGWEESLDLIPSHKSQEVKTYFLMVVLSNIALPFLHARCLAYRYFFYTHC